MPPRCRWDFRESQLQALGRKYWNFRVIVGERRCCAQEFLLGLWQDLEMAGRLWEINSINICDKAWLPIGSSLDVCNIVVVPSPRLDREEGGCLSSSLLLSICCVLHLMRQPWLLIVHTRSRQCVSATVMFFSLWQHLARSYLFNERTNKIEQVLWSWQYLQNFKEFLFLVCQVQCSFSCILDTKFCLRTPQVGFSWITTSSTWEEILKFQGRRRRRMEVPCSGFPLGSLARFWDGCRLWKINFRVWNGKDLKRLT